MKHVFYLDEQVVVWARTTVVVEAMTEEKAIQRMEEAFRDRVKNGDQIDAFGEDIHDINQEALWDTAEYPEADTEATAILYLKDDTIKPDKGPGKELLHNWRL